MKISLFSPENSKFVKALDILIISFTGLLLILAIIFSSKVNNWEIVVRNYFIIGVAYFLISNAIGKINSSFWQIFARGGLIAAVNGLLFSEIQHLQHIFVNGWMDQQLIDLDRWIFGIELTVASDKITVPWLTEAMMFAYTAYVPLIVLVAVFCYLKSGKLAGEDYLFNLTFGYFLSYLGFLIYPIAGPLFFQPEVYKTPLEGGLFTYFGEWIRTNAHYPGGNLPSPHCAAGTVMLVMLHKYNKNIFYVILPIILLLYISTVYGRYHYAMDGVLGIITAFIVVKYSTRFVDFKK
ncbi:MAG: phosphatase PAP2 family protein [Bacteroidota bacterium]|nr:phosphatase PAP2 family protein [Bacteroidota bacterium]